MPENAKLTVIQLPGFISLNRFVDAQVLMVPGEDLCGVAAGMVVENEVFQQIQEVFLLTDTPEHGSQSHTSLFLLVQTLPFMEKFILASQCAHLGFRAVGEDQEGIVVEQMGNGVQVVGVVVGVGILDIHIVLFEFHEQQRNAIHKTNDIRTLPVEIAVDLQLFNGEEMVVFGILEIHNGSVLCLRSSAGLFYGDGDAVPDQEILFLVDLQQRRGTEPMRKGALGLVHLGRGDPGIQAQQSLPKIPGQQNLFIAFPPKGAAFAQLFRIVGIRNLPAQLVTEQIACTVLD